MAACSDKKEVTPTSGAVQVELNIAGATNAVTLTSAGGQAVSAPPDAATGKFVFTQVVPGTYSLTAVPADGFRSPSEVPLTVKAGETATARLVFNRDFSIGGTMSWEQNGVLYTASHLSGSLSSTRLWLIGTTGILPGGGTKEVRLVLPENYVGNVAPF